MIASVKDLIRYIPQREPMVMIHGLEEVSEQHAVTFLHIFSTNIFVKEGKLREPGLIENIAQSAAVQAGYLCIKNGIPVTVGFIARIKKLEIMEFPPVNVDIQTTISITNNVFDMSMVTGEIFWREKLICHCEMTIFIKK